MTLSGCLLLADAAVRTELADAALHTRFELGRFQTEPGLAILACVLGLVLLAFVGFMYRLDGRELPALVAWLLGALRAAALLGLLFYFLQPHWRSEREVVRDSRVALLVDTSLSMGLSDASADKAPGSASRVGQVAAALAETDLLAKLRQTHDVVVYQFNNTLDRDRMMLLGKRNPQATVADPPARQPATTRPSDAKAAPTPEEWQKFLIPAGTETRLGESLQQLIQQERGNPLAGVVVFSDGGQNAGAGPENAVELAREARVPLFTVGLGSDKKPANVRLSDLAAPLRAYPGDQYTVTGYVRAQGLAGRTVLVQLLSRPMDATGDHSRRGTGRVEQTKSLVLGEDGKVAAVEFKLTPEKDKLGWRTLCLKIEPPKDDQDPADKYREADIEIVAHKNHVLLLAGGPTREYQFLRTMLYRDQATNTADVLLQSWQPGGGEEAAISQEVKIIADFPATAKDMSDYDCVVAFDPNWQALRAAQVDTLHDWVDNQSGGLIVIPGPVYAGKEVNSWTQDPTMSKIRNLYPVEFNRQFAAEGEQSRPKDAWSLEFTREGQQADFLWLGDGVSASRRTWAQFAGVFSCFPVRNVKPGATELARFSDPRAAVGGRQPPYFVEQFYGSGRVFYMGSGELWRLRSVDPTYFDQLYMKLIRHVSQGRLLRGSRHGVLLVGQDRYLLGNTVEVRAQLTNARMQPLSDSSVVLEVVPPAGAVQKVTLATDPSRPGTFTGQFAVLQEGAYRLELPVPEVADERITRRIQVKVPELERENPQRNDALLNRIAIDGGGKYYLGITALLEGMPAVSGKAAVLPLVRLLKDHTSVEHVPETANPVWENRLLLWLMIGLCGVLCLEWLIRRLLKLA